MYQMMVKRKENSSIYLKLLGNINYRTNMECSLAKLYYWQKKVIENDISRVSMSDNKVRKGNVIDREKNRFGNRANA